MEQNHIRAFDKVCFLSHQVVEKIFSAVSEVRGIPFFDPHKHHLVEKAGNLQRELQDEWPREMESIRYDCLNYYIAARYPPRGFGGAPVRILDHAKALEALQEATRIHAALQKFFS